MPTFSSMDFGREMIFTIVLNRLAVGAEIHFNFLVDFC